MYRLKKLFLMVGIFLFVALGIGVQPSRADTFDFQILAYSSGSCSIGAGSEFFGFGIQYNNAPVGTIITASIVSGPAGLSGSSSQSISGSGTGGLGFVFSSLATPAPWSFTIKFEANINGSLSYLAQVSCPAGGIPYTVTPLGYGSAVVFGEAGPPGPPIPEGYILKYITCDVAVFSEPDVDRATSARIKAGQTWYVNPKPVTGKDGKQWQQIFTSSSPDGYIPSACIN